MTIQPVHGHSQKAPAAVHSTPSPAPAVPLADPVDLCDRAPALPGPEASEARPPVPGGNAPSALPTRSARQPLGPPPPLSVIAFLDGTDRAVEPVIRFHLDRLQQAHQAGVRVTAEMYRRTPTPNLTISGLGLRILAPGLAGLAVAGAVTGAPLLGCAILALGAGAARLLHSRDQGQERLRTATMRRQTADPEWAGARRYRMEPQGMREEPVAPEARPTPDRLRRLLVAGMRTCPGERNVLYVSGHGAGFRRLASMPGADFARAIAAGVREANEPVGLLVTDSCLMGNLEAMALLPEGMQAVVASERPVAEAFIVPGRHREARGELALALESALPDGQAGSPLDLARLVVERAPEQPEGSSFFALDLGALRQRLMPALDRLGGHLVESSDPAGVLAVRAAPEVQPALDYRDLGGFLEGLQARTADPETARLAAEARAALASTVLARKTSGAYSGDSGLSFQATAANLQDVRDPALDLVFGVRTPSSEVPLPAGWRRFLVKVAQESAPPSL